MKRILAFMFVVILALSLCACGGTAVNAPKLAEVKDKVGSPDKFVSESAEGTEDVASSDEAATADEAKAKNKYPNTLVGMCEYLADKNCICEVSYDKKEKKLTVDESVKDSLIVPEAELIGAEDGYKFTYIYDGGTVVVEVYSYKNTDNQWYKQAREEGKITLSDKVENGTFDAIISENGKYLMVYNDSAKGEKRDERRDDVIAVFNSFYNTAE